MDPRPPSGKTGGKDGLGRLFEKMAVLTEGLEFPDIHLFEGFLHRFPEGLVCIAHAAL